MLHNPRYMRLLLKIFLQFFIKAKSNFRRSFLNKCSCSKKLKNSSSVYHAHFIFLEGKYVWRKKSLKKSIFFKIRSEKTIWATKRVIFSRIFPLHHIEKVYIPHSSSIIPFPIPLVTDALVSISIFSCKITIIVRTYLLTTYCYLPYI